MDNTVISLSVPALRYAVEICEQNPDFIVGVAVSDKSKLYHTVDKLTDYVDWFKFEKIGNVVCKFISFKNGSRIYIDVASNCSRGHRWNTLILDEEVDKKVYRNLLRHCNTRPYPVNK